MMPALKPAFQVEKLKGKVEHKRFSYEPRDTGRKDRNGNPIMTHIQKVETVKEDAGYMVYFPRGHSIRVRDDAELKRLGLDRNPHLSDPTGQMSDEDIARMTAGNMSLKEQSAVLVRQNTRGLPGQQDQLANPEGD